MEDTMRKAGFALASLLIAVLLLGGPGWALAAPGQTLIVTGNRVNVRYGPSADAKVRMKITRDQLVRELERQGDWVRAEIVGAGASGWISSSLLAVPSAERLARARQGAPESPRAGMPEPKPSAAPGAASAGPAGPTPPAIPPAPGKPQPSSSSGGHTSTAPVPPTSASSSAEPAAAPPSPGKTASEPSASEQAAIAPATGPAETTDPPELARFRDSVDYLNSRSKSVDGTDLFERVEEVGDGVVRVGATKAWASIPPASQQSYANALVDRWAAARGYSGPATVQIVDPDGKLLLESKKP
jgi:hypothetical protein